jgi:predicted MFS family arabinose efflux permease
MTTTIAPTVRPRLISRALVLVFVADFGALMSLYLMLAVVPLYVTTSGAGVTTAAIMLSSIASELAAPRLLARYGYRAVLAASLLMMGLPALTMPLLTDLTGIMAACAVHGLGFGLMVVAALSLAAEVIPAQRRGEGLGLFGAGIMIPGVIGLPLGVWLATHVGFTVVFLISGLAALVALVGIPGLPGRATQVERPAGILAALRNPALTRPALAFLATSTAAGIVVAFIPLAVGTSTDVATVALLAQSAAATLTRWLAGRVGDRHGPSRLLIPGLLLAASGILALTFVGTPVAVIVGMTVFGIGFGICQNVTLAIMLNRAAPTEYSSVNAVWNLSYDAGWGLGAAAFGAAATHTGFPTAFAITGTLMLTALVPASRDRASVR